MTHREDYAALRENCAWFALEGRGRLRLAGEDARRLLHSVSAQHIEQLQPGQGSYSLFLDAQGRILADAHILCLPDGFLLDTESEAAESLTKHLDSYIIMDDVMIEDLTEASATIALEGPDANRIVEKLGMEWPAQPFWFTEWDGATLLRATYTGKPGIWLLTTGERRPEFEAKLRAEGVVEAGEIAREAVRLENGRARFPLDMGPKHLPQESQLLHGLHFQKGCYLGHEIVERIRARGAVRRRLMQLTIQAGEPPAPGNQINAEGDNVGEITSAAWSPAEGAVAALGYVRQEQIAGRPLSVGGMAAQIRAERPWQPFA